jgi:hypothetical protein
MTDTSSTAAGDKGDRRKRMPSPDASDVPVRVRLSNTRLTRWKMGRLKSSCCSKNNYDHARGREHQSDDGACREPLPKKEQAQTCGERWEGGIAERCDAGGSEFKTDIRQ